MISDQLTDLPRLVWLLDYWNAKRAGRRWPSRADIDPIEMQEVLGNLDLLEITYDPLVFRFRLSGSNIDSDEGFNMQGKTLEEYPLPQHQGDMRKTFMSVLESGDPNFEEIERWNEGKTARYGRLILPLSKDGARIDMFLVGRYALKR